MRLAQAIRLQVLLHVAPGRALLYLHAHDPRFALAGERLAERTLRSRGWRLLARRLATRHGECDLVMEDGRTLVVVEVKTGRAGPRYSPGMRLDRAALERRWRAARLLARGRPARVDLLEVRLEQPARVGPGPAEPVRRPRVVQHADLRRPLAGPGPGDGTRAGTETGVTPPGSEPFSHLEPGSASADTRSHRRPSRGR